MDVARDTLTSIRAAPELIASGHEGAYLERLRASVNDWTATAARAERNAAVFQRIPLAAVVVVEVVLVVRTQSLELGQLIRLGVFFPPIAGLMRTMSELIKTAPRVHALGVALDARISVGTRQRMMLARIVGAKSPLIVMDEPDENLDTQARGPLMRRAKERHAARGIVVATHDAQVLAVCGTTVSLG
jgi:ABC-type transport system involved in cytochrome bd biosynthesis fused ATPase/permease subunit